MKRKSTAYRIVQAFILVVVVMLLPAKAWAQETNLTTVVPASHTLHIELTGNGTVVVDGVSYTQAADLQVQRHSKPEITVLAADGSKIKTVLWGNEDVTVNFQNGKWTMPEVTEDIILSVAFEKISSTPQTGDAFDLNLWASLLIVSAFGMIICLLSIKKKMQ